MTRFATGSIRVGLGVITGIAARAWTDFAALGGQTCLTHLFGHLTQAGFSGFGEGFHAFSAAAVLLIELCINFLPLLNFSMSWLVLRILASTAKVLNGTSTTSTSLTTMIPNLSPSLTQRHNTNTWFSSTLGVLTLPAAVLKTLSLVSRGATIAAGTGTVIRWSLTTHFYDYLLL